MKFLRVFLFLLFTAAAASAQDNCNNATALCGGSSVSSTTIGGTTVAGDPALGCGDGTVERSIWFTVLGINIGTAVITVTNIDNNPGLTVSAYTGTCGTLAPIAAACNAGNGPAGSTVISFATAPGVTYYIMVDGEMGNQEGFTITATTPDDGIIARPSANFTANPIVACVPACITLTNTTVPHGTPVTYSWRLCTTCPYLPASGADTTVCIDSIGTYEISIRATNACGTTIYTQEITIQDLFPAISYSPVTTCVGQPVSFTGSASVLPDPPYTNPNIVSWFWDFGDPLSGANNTSALQNPTHVFVGSPPFTVTLIVDGACGPDTTSIVVNLLPPPVVTASAPSPVCQGTAVSLTSSVSNATAPVAYQWLGPGTIACDTCQNTSVTGLPPGGPYVYTITITDANGCTATDTTSVVITPLPIANAGNDTTVCRYSSVQLNGSASSGTPPYTYAWTPGTGLSDSTIANPTTTVSANVTYCLVVTDSLGCISSPDCVDLNVFPPPTLNSPPSILCATDPNPLMSTFTVTGAGAGSTYEWYLSADYTYITSANADSSSVTATYPSGVPATYNFTVIVTDGVTGCVDTLSTAFTIQPGLTMTLNGPFTICAGQSVTLTATGATTYAWTASPVYAFADSTLASQNVSPAVTTTFTVLGTTGTCSQQLSATVNVNPLPVAVAAPIPPFCGCDTVSLDGTGSTPGMSYLWTSAGGNPIGSPASLITTSVICTSDVFTLVVTDTATGCSDSVSVAANATVNPAATATVLPNIICNGVVTVVTLDGTGSDTNPGTTYQWSSSPAVPITDTTALVTTATVSTTTIFTLTVTAATGCDSTVTATVNIYPPPVLTGNPGALCTTDPQIVTLAITGAGAGSTYNWIIIPPCAVPNTTAAQSQVFDLSGCGVGNYTFTVVVTDGVTGCIDTISTVIPIVAGVTLTTSGNQTICEGDALTLSANGALSYQWSNGDTTSSTVVSPPLLASGSPYQFTVIGTTGSCSDSDTVIVTVNPVPVTSPINGLTSVCENVLGQMYTTTGSPGSTFFWTVTGGTIASGQGNDTIYIDWGSAGGGTITVVETNSFGCAGAPVSLNITINPLPNTSAITGPDTVCAGSSANYSVTNIAGSTYNWTVTGGTYTGSGSNINVTWGAAGTGTVTVVETNAVGCSDTAVTMNVVINPVPVTPPITGPTPVCEGTLGSIYTVPPAAGSAYTWSVSGNGNIVSGQGTDSVIIDWGLAGTATITVTEVNAFGCPGAPQTLTVTINATPTANASAVQDTVCAGSNVQLNGVATNGTILWTTSGSGSFSNNTSANPTYTTAGTDTPSVMLIMTVSNPPCPDAVDTVTITVIPLPVTSVITGPDTVCANSIAAVYSVAGNAGSVYSWTVAGGTISGGNGTNQITVSWGAAGAGTVSVTEYNFFGCMGSTSTLNVVINPSPVPITISGPDTLCQDEFGQYIASPSTPGSIYTWAVSAGIPGTQGDDTMNVQWTVPGNQQLIVTEMNAFGCIGVTNTFDVVVNPIPAPLILIGPDTVCEYDTVIYYVAGTPGSTYTWNVTGGLFVPTTGDTLIVFWGMGTGGSISVSETNSFGCTGSTLITNIVFNPRPSPAYGSYPTIACAGDTGLIYSVGNPGAGSYFLWTIFNGTITSPYDSTSSVTVTWGSPPSGWVTVQEVSPLGCISNPLSFNVTINPNPTAFVNPIADTICVNQSIQLNGVASTNNILWLTSGSGTFSTTVNDTTTYTPSPSDTGTIVLSMVVSNSPCPDSTATVTLTVIPLPVISHSPDTTICFGDSATLSASGGVSYVWTPGNDTTSTIIVYPPATTWYYVTVTNFAGCSSTDSMQVFVTPWGTAAAGNDTAICNTDSLMLNGNVQNAGGGNWTTTGDGTFIPNAQTLNATYAPGPGDIAAGTDTLILTTTGNPCRNQSDTIIVALNSFLSVYAGPDQIINRGGLAPVSGSVTGSNSGWWSSTGSGTFIPDSNSLAATYHPGTADYNSGFIFLILHSTNACNTATDTLMLLFPDFRIPNVFTPQPNTPGYNDYFEIEGLPDNSSLEIFNRWGMLVFHADNYRNNWDAAEVNDDTYYYILNTPDKKSYHGFVRVIKKE